MKKIILLFIILLPIIVKAQNTDKSILYPYIVATKDEFLARVKSEGYTVWKDSTLPNAYFAKNMDIGVILVKYIQDTGVVFSISTLSPNDEKGIIPSGSDLIDPKIPKWDDGEFIYTRWVSKNPNNGLTFYRYFIRRK